MVDGSHDVGHQALNDNKVAEEQWVNPRNHSKRSGHGPNRNAEALDSYCGVKENGSFRVRQLGHREEG